MLAKFADRSVDSDRLRFNVDHVNMTAVTTSRLLSTSEAARRLGVKRETVYAYVSRGLLERHAASEHHRSLFDRDAVERLAASARRRDRSGALDVVVDTQLTLLDPDGRLFYRGRDVIALARFRTFEQVAGLLWDGDPGAPWELDPETASTVATLREALREDIAPADRIPLLIAGLGATDPDRGDRRPAAVRRAGRRMLAGVLDGIPASASTASADRSAASRLWVSLTTGAEPPRPAQRAALDAALILLADHELAASALAARVAASAWADPYRVVLAGLGPLGGALHGAASLAVEAMLTRATATDTAFGLLDQHSVDSTSAPGFGHPVYRNRDPRADHLLGRVSACAVDTSSAAAVANLISAAAARGLPAPNADLALGGLAFAMKLKPGSAAAIFTIARLVGLLAHAIEEYPHRLRFRPRATYVGPAPGS